MLKMHQALAARRKAILNGEQSDEGFTLIELLIVVLIIGVLAAIAIPVYLSTVQNSKDTSAKDAATAVVTAIGVWATENTTGGTVPATTDFTGATADSTLTASLPGEGINVWYVPSGTPATGYVVVTQYTGSSKWYKATDSSTVTELSAAPAEAVAANLVHGTGE